MKLVIISTILPMQMNSKSFIENSKYNGKLKGLDNTENDNSKQPSFLELLCNEIRLDYKLKKYKIRKSTIEPVLFEIDDSHKFRNSVSISKGGNLTIQSLSNSSRNSTMKDYMKKKQLKIDLKKQYNQYFKSDLKLEKPMPVEIVDWERDVCCNSEEESIHIKAYINELLESDWEKHICLDPQEMKVSKNTMTLYIDDPNLIIEKVEEKKTKLKKKIVKIGNTDKPLKNKFNISNDKYYINEIKSKASLDTFGVQHSLPALKLDNRYYKTNNTKEELRNFHRPPCPLSNREYIFKPVIKSKFTGSIIKKSHELTLSDSTPIVVFEYSEEFPFFVVNPGMVSLINTYYRKIDSSDEPVNENTIILEPDDDAPFFGFGNVKPGASISTLANNLFISPIFKHKTTDFLCILDEGNIFIRSISSIYLVGQEFPKEEVYAPHSRKLNHFCKDRLKVSAYRIFNKGKDLQMQQLDQMFPYFSEGSKRKWLKEYSDCVKKGKDNVWMLRDSFSIIGEEDLRKLVTPENICQYESMLSAERRMQDLGYKCLETEDDDQEYDNYSPNWHLSRNFVNAANGRGLLELFGPGDPSGNGEAFSFRKIRLKKGNESENRKIINEHQATYKERIDEIWNKQIDVLSNETPIKYIPSTSSNFDSPSETTGNEANSLIIKRIYKEDCGFVTKIEKIYDQKLIKAYLKAKRKPKQEERKPTLTCSSCGQSGHMKTNKSCPNFIGAAKPQKKKADDIKKPSVVFQDRLLKLTSCFIAIPFSNAFHRPVSAKKFPNYKNIIKNPMDLSTIKNKIKEGKYSTYSMFLDDLTLMKDNCAINNGASHSLTEIAETICTNAHQYYEKHKEEILEFEKYIELEQRGETVL